MKKFVFIITILSLLGCKSKNRISHYCFDNTCFTKVNKTSGNTDFYYGKIINEENLPDHGVKCEYYGFSNGMQAYFLFQPDSTICIIPLMGTFIAFGNADNHLQICEMTNANFRNWDDTIVGKYNNVVLISNASEFEINHNKENDSKVILLP